MTRPTRALIDRTALGSNIRLLRSRLPGNTRIMGIAKADCYGHGAAICIPEMLAAGIDIFGVATAQEAIGLRELGVAAPVVVLPPPLDGEYALFAEHALEATVSTPLMARALSAAADAAGRRIGVHLFLDTGMARNGVASSAALDLLREIVELPGLELSGFASHFATSDEPDNPFTLRQLAIFDDTLRRATEAGYTFRDIHIANSGGILNFPASHYNLVRPGLSLYGFHPTPERQENSGLLPVMRLRTVVANITPLPSGTSVSYGRRYVTTIDTRIATLPIGYADGVMRILTNNLEVLIRGRRYPVVGTICMDEVMADLGPARDGADIAIGDEAVVIGASGGAAIDGWEVARRARTIPYEICSNISKRVPRVPC